MYKVLIVDDEPTLQEGLKVFIPWRQLGCEIAHIASNGEAAMAYIRQNEVDIAVLDVRMPGMDGLTLLAAIAREYAHIRAIVLTAYADFSYAHTALRLDAVDYIVKINYEQELPQAIRKATAQLARQAAEPGAGAGAAEDEAVPSMVPAARQYIANHYMEPISLSDVVAHLHVNSSHLCRAFKKETGRSVNEEINQLRMQKARMLLLEGRKVFEVAGMLGYSDPSYFTRVFTRIVGKTPREFVEEA